MVIAHSFWTQDYLTIDHTFTLEDYRIALTEPIYRDLLWRSLYISLTVSLLTVVLAYPVAYFISFHGGRHKGLWLFLITIPFWTSYLLRVMRRVSDVIAVPSSVLFCFSYGSATLAAFAG